MAANSTVKLSVKRSGVEHILRVNREVARLLVSSEIDGDTKDCILNDLLKCEEPAASCSTVQHRSEKKCQEPATSRSTVQHRSEKKCQEPATSRSSVQHRSEEKCQEPATSRSTVHVWTVAEEKALVQLRADKDSLFQSSKSHDFLWRQISDSMLRDTKTFITTTQCKDKFKNIKKKYSEFKDCQNKTGEERRPQPPYYETLDCLYGHRATSQPKQTMDSMPGQGRAAVAVAAAAVGKGNEDEPIQGDLDDNVTPQKPKKPKMSDRVSPQDKIVDLMNKADERQNEVKEMLTTQHTQKMQRLDRFLDLLERSLDK